MSSGSAVATADVAVNPSLMASVNGALVLATVLTPLLSAELVEAPCRVLRTVLPPVGAVAAQAIRAAADACHALRGRRELLFMLVHGALTYSTGDLIAQAALSSERTSRSPSGATGTEAARERDKRSRRCAAVSWRPLRSARAALVGVLSDTLPFYHWSVALEKLDHSWLVRRWPVLLRKPALLLAIKVFAHVLTFQPTCTASYLILQQLLRGESWRGALRFLKLTFVAAFAPAFFSFLAGGPVVYSLPSVLLQGALRNLGVLAISVYLAVVSSA